MKNDRFEVFTSFLIAVVTILGAITAWRASVASIHAGDADFDGLSASIRSQEERVLNSVRAYEHLRAYTAYFRYNELGYAIDASSSIHANREKSELLDIALDLQYLFFPARYLNRDGDYNLQRELEERWALSNEFKDLNPEPHFNRGDAFREKANILTLSLIIFAISFFFLALSQALNNFFRYIFAGIGCMALLGGLCAMLIFEFSV